MRFYIIEFISHIKLRKTGKEKSHHHKDAEFIIYTGDYKGYHLKVKTKQNNDGEFMYAFEIEKVR